MRSVPVLKVVFVVVIVLTVLIAPKHPITFAQSNLANQATPVSASPRAASANSTVFLPYVNVGVARIKSSSTKKGVGLTYQDCASATTLGAKWQFGWMTSPANCAGIENVPMISVAGDVNTTLGGNSNWVMGFNEPDSAGATNLSPSSAATLWRQIEQKYPNRKLLAPAPSGANPTWLVDFRNAYIAAFGAPPRLDALAVHCFAWSADACIQHTQLFEGWASSWGVPEVWVTEFSISPAAPNTPSQAIQEETTFLNWLDAEPMVTRYAWFASLIQGTEPWVNADFVTPLIDWNTRQPTTFGSVY